MTKSAPVSVENVDHIYELMVALESSVNVYGPSHPQTVAAATSLATVFWQAGEIDQAIGLLRQVLSDLTLSAGSERSSRDDVLSKLAEICFRQGRLEQAQEFQREVLESRIRDSGPNHPKSLEAKGELALVLFALGDHAEAGRLEQEAFEAARTHLGKTHRVSCVLAWNRVLSHERRGDRDAALRIIVNELVWLLGEQPSKLGGTEEVIRARVCERLNWDQPRVC